MQGPNNSEKTGVTILIDRKFPAGAEALVRCTYGFRIALGISLYQEDGLMDRETLVMLDSNNGEILNEIDDIGGQGEITPDGKAIAVHRLAGLCALWRTSRAIKYPCVQF